MSTVNIWVGTDSWQQASGAERVLEYSIRKHASCPVYITWMRAGDPGFIVGDTRDADWQCGHDGTQAWPKRGWGTPFSLFRMAVPELAGFTGTHVYMDADMLVLGDVADLLKFKPRAPWFCNHPRITDVSVIDAGNRKLRAELPSIGAMKAGMMLHTVVANLYNKGLMDTTLPWAWNCRDSNPPDAKLIHYTSVPTQPWQPYHSVSYRTHPNLALRDLWFQYQQEANGSGKGTR